MHRGWQDNPIFKDERYTEREAWEWLIAEASFEFHKIRYKSRMIEVTRGQVPTSYRNLAAKFRWGNERIRRFISLLKSEEMLTTQTGTGFLIITISNYEKYQKPVKKAGTQIDTPPGTLAGTNINKLNKDADDRRSEFVKISEEIQTLMKGKILNTQGIHAWLEAGADQNLIIETLKVCLARRSGDPPNSLSYFNQPIADAIKAKTQPLPEGNYGKSQQNNGQGFNNSRKQTVTEATTEIIAAISRGEF